jgi:hypothetical protein
LKMPSQTAFLKNWFWKRAASARLSNINLLSALPKAKKDPDWIGVFLCYALLLLRRLPAFSSNQKNSVRTSC